MKKKLYISLPITGKNIEDVKFQADSYKDVFSFKYDVVTPFDICDEPDRPYSHYMGEDMKVLLECDAVFFAPGFSRSKGCQLEFAAAKIYGKEIIV